jgi:ubiquitin carboxyl-terminal hydrolase 36/42
MSPISLASIKNDKTAYLLSYIRLAEGEEIPAGAQSNVHVNGNGSAANGLPNGVGWVRNPEPVPNTQQQQGGKRKRDDEAIGDTMRQPIRKNLPASIPSTPLFTSSLNGGTQVPFGQNPPSPAGSDKTVEDDQRPDYMSAFGAGMNDNKVFAPRPVPGGNFYGSSPIPRPHNPGPQGRRNGGRNGGNRKHGRNSNSSPYNAGGGAGGKGGGRGGKAFGGKQKGMYNRMQGRR